MTHTVPSRRYSAVRYCNSPDITTISPNSSPCPRLLDICTRFIYASMNPIHHMSVVSAYSTTTMARSLTVRRYAKSGRQAPLKQFTTGGLASSVRWVGYLLQASYELPTCNDHPSLSQCAWLAIVFGQGLSMQHINCTVRFPCIGAYSITVIIALLLTVRTCARVQETRSARMAAHRRRSHSLFAEDMSRCALWPPALRPQPPSLHAPPLPANTRGSPSALARSAAPVPAENSTGGHGRHGEWGIACRKSGLQITTGVGTRVRER